MAIAVVTGSSTGIGQASAITLARAGHTVYATMRNPETGGEELRVIASKENLPLRFAALDVNSDQSVQTAFGTILEEARRIDVLVNNAGIGNMGAVEETLIDNFRAVMETNFFGALRCVQAVLPGMREQRTGCIINVTSVAGRFSAAPQAPYASSKFALEALSECLAQEMKVFCVRVAIVEPGVIATPIFGKVGQTPSSTRYPQRRRLMDMHISKEGDPYLRTLLVQGAHHILGPFGVDSDLRRWGLKLAERSGKSGKKRAIIAVARKLAILLHRLWVSGEVYEPLRNSTRITMPAAA
jgi:NAD(P)-dependent dehydrogenase (short-subunit alcohol dehydrogenase family)